MIDSVSEYAGARPDLKRSRCVKGDASVGGTLGRLPPHANEAEMGVLGCCLLDPNQCIGECVEKLKDDGKMAFYDLRHQTIYETLSEMFNVRSPIDLITVQQHLKDRQLLEQIGGIAYLSQLQDAVPSAANLAYYLDIVREKYLLRKLITTCSEVVGKLFDYEGEVESLISEVEREVLSVRSDASAGASAASLVLEATNELERAFESGGKITGLSTGLRDLDNLTDGLHDGEMVVLAAFPSCGKTSLAMNIAEHNFLSGIPVGIASCEMLPRKLIRRSVCSVARVNFRDVQRGRVSQEDFEKMTVAAGRIAAAPVHIEGTSGMSVQQVVAIARRMKQRHRIRLFVIDYIQLLTCKADSREREVAGISAAIKGIATQLEIPVIALSQLNDDGKLRESRTIGQDGDTVIILENAGEWNPIVQPIKATVQKCRDGETGKVSLTFLKTITRFENAAKEEHEV